MTPEQEAKALAAAKQEYMCEEIAVDDNATFSESPEGVWVSAWVWVPKEEYQNEHD